VAASPNEASTMHAKHASRVRSTTARSFVALCLIGACSSPRFTASESTDAGTGGRGGKGSGGTSPSEGGDGGTAETGGTGGGKSTGGNGGTSGGKATGGTGGSSASGGSGGSGGIQGGTGGRGGVGGTGGTGGASGSGGALGGSAGSGDAGTGGSEMAGMGGGGGLTGMSGSAGLGTAGLGTAGSVSVAFPSYGVLDDFNREGPALGISWVGAVGYYEIANQTLTCSASYCPAVLYEVSFGPVQEVFAKLVMFNETTPEINLVLKAQGNVDCDLLEVLYEHQSGRVLIEGCWSGSWHSLGTIEVSLELGDQLGGRVGSDGFLQVFKNGTLAGSVDANEYPFIDQAGRIGVNGVNWDGAETVVNGWDDFGGGGS
jgi:hypothetical protein